MKDEAKIGVQCGTTAGKHRCVVTVSEGQSETRHNVTVDEEYKMSIAGSKATVEEMVRQSFRFLLQREPKESILREFDLRVVGRYFPEYERAIRKMLGEDGKS